MNQKTSVPVWRTHSCVPPATGFLHASACPLTSIGVVHAPGRHSCERQAWRVNLAAVLCALLVSSGCMVGPTYRRPPAPAPVAFKEKPPDGWKEAQPNDAALKGKWWEIYNDPQLNALEEQVSISNQNVLATFPGLTRQPEKYLAFLNTKPSTLDGTPFKTLAGAALSTSDWKGKVVVLNYLATWCVPCRAEFGAFHGASVALGAVDRILPIDQIAEGLVRLGDTREERRAAGS